MPPNASPGEMSLYSIPERGEIPQWLLKELRDIEANHPEQKDLNLRYRFLGAAGGGHAIRHALRKTRTLKSITVGGVHPGSARRIVEGICKNSSLRKVHIELFSDHGRWDDPKNDDVPHLLGKKLTYTKSNLVVLRLFWGHIGSRGLRSISRGLEVNTSLEVLNLGHNSLGDSGTRRLCRALKHNSTLRGLYLQHNGIGQDGGLALAQLLRYNTSIETVSLDGNDLGGETMAKFASVLQRQNTTLKFMYVNDEASYKPITRQIGYWCALNRAHRKHAWDEQLPLTLWQIILAKVCDHPSLIYGLLREKPDLILNASPSEESSESSG